MTSALQMRPLEYIVLEVCLPGATPERAGVILLDKAANRLYVKARRDWESFETEESEVLSGLEETIESMVRDHGAAETLAYIESTFDGVIRSTDRQQTVAADPEARLRRLYRENVNTVGAVPVIKLSAAAGGLSEEQLPGDVIGSIDPPSGIRPAPGMFAAKVVGCSMEPLIPDGSYCLFKPHGGGSRSGAKLLIEKFGSTDATAQFTVKVYRSEKRMNEDGTWEHERIRMIPLNPEFEEWNLTPDEFKVIGEFVAVLPAEE
ncbi:MAG: helix-turn-helix transcriptional regulator [Acidobacteria bacterium]|nr:helix-turn-helix transcriptional regulator [Acidobacteriota bacterium]